MTKSVVIVTLQEKSCSAIQNTVQRWTVDYVLLNITPEMYTLQNLCFSVLMMKNNTVELVKIEQAIF